MRDYVKSVPVCCPPCVAKRLRQRNYVQFKSSTSSVPRNFGKYRSCIGILICASHRHLPPFCAITVITFRSVSFQFSSINWLFFGSLILGLWFVGSCRFFSSSQSIHARCVPFKRQASERESAFVVSVRFRKKNVKVNVVLVIGGREDLNCERFHGDFVKD